MGRLCHHHPGNGARGTTHRGVGCWSSRSLKLSPGRLPNRQLPISLVCLSAIRDQIRPSGATHNRSPRRRPAGRGLFAPRQTAGRSRRQQRTRWGKALEAHHHPRRHLEPPAQSAPYNDDGIFWLSNRQPLRRGSPAADRVVLAAFVRQSDQPAMGKPAGASA